MKKIARERWAAISAWWAMVSVAPGVSSGALLIVGIGHGPMVVKGSTVPAGEAVAPACTLGQTALKSGHRMAFCRLPSVGTLYSRDQNSAPKKAPKNITSEKMNQLMLQRNDMSILWPYRPFSLSPMAWRNHCCST